MRDRRGQGAVEREKEGRRIAERGQGPIKEGGKK